MLGNRRVDQLAAMSLQPSECALFIDAHQPAISGDISRQDGRQPSLGDARWSRHSLSKIGYGIIIPETISGFSQLFETRFAQRIDLLSGALPAQYGYRTVKKGAACRDRA